MAQATTMTAVSNHHTWDRVVELYEGGHKIKDIMADTAMSKSEVYYVLKRRGIAPSRQSSSETTISAADLQSQLMLAHEQIGVLQARLREYEEQSADT